MPEIGSNYDAYLKQVSAKHGVPIDTILEKIRYWNNGYKFLDPDAVKDAKVFSPYSVMLYLQSGSFDNYWFDTGTPSFLMRLIKIQNYPISTIEDSEINISQTKSYEIKDIELIPLLWQAGYLTVKGYNPITKNFKLTWPNEEVKVSFFEHIMRKLAQVDEAWLSSLLAKLSQSIKKVHIDEFFETVKIFFAHIPYDMHIPAESYYQTFFFTIMTLLGQTVRSEDRTNDGRIDAVIEINSHILLFEFKLHDTAESALAQIEQKQY